MELGHLCWLIYQSQAPTLPQTLGNKGDIFLNDCMLKEWLPGPQERLSQVIKLAGG